MRRLLVVLALAAPVVGPVACGADDQTGRSSSVPASGDATAPDSTPNGPSGDAARDGDTDASGEPAVQLVGRFDVTGGGTPRAAWPGVRIVARFTGTGVSVRLSQAAGPAGNSSWMNVSIDGVSHDPIEVTGPAQVFRLATGLESEGPHVVELEKRTEANLGTVTLDELTFEGGQLLAPPLRASRRIEFLSESTIAGFGVDGNGPDDPATCNGGAPPPYHDAGKSAAKVAAGLLQAEHHLLAYSGKGVVRNNQAGDTATFPLLYPRTLPDVPGSDWDSSSWRADAVVVSLGGTDYGGSETTPEGFEDAYAQLVAAARARHPDAYVLLTIWSQLKAHNGVRPALRSVLDSVVASRAAAGDAKVSRFELPEAAFPGDETGCHYHANAAHHEAMAKLLAAEIERITGW
jgi:hypothetical protein